jgi:hypothetical protein
MKLKSLLFSAFMLTTFFMMAQSDWSSDTYKYRELYPGYIVKDGEKIEGFVQYTNRHDLQSTVVFYTDKNDRKSKTKYKSKDLTEYKMADKVYHVINYTGGLLSKPLGGNLLIQDGCIKKYVYYSKDTDVTTRNAGETQEEYMNRRYPSTVLYMKDGDEKPQTVAKLGMGFAKQAPEWLADQPELAQKIANKEKGYKFINMDAVVEEYNANCEK